MSVMASLKTSQIKMAAKTQDLHGIGYSRPQRFIDQRFTRLPLKMTMNEKRLIDHIIPLGQFKATDISIKSLRNFTSQRSVRMTC